MNNIVQKFQEVSNYLNLTVLEKEQEVESILALLISQQHGFLLGVPGVGKSYLINKVMGCFTDAIVFEKLMMATTTPQELFGPLSLSALRNDELKHNTKGYMSEAHVAFIDEIWKANSQTSNSKLTLMNERKFHNGNQIEKSPLISLFGASNELPSNSSLEAIYDRFVVRMVVEPIRNPDNFVKMVMATSIAAPKVLSVGMLQEAHLLSKQVDVTPILEALVELREEMKFVCGGEVYVSDRRWKMVLSYLQGLAILYGDTALDEDYFAKIANCLWSDPKHQAEVNTLLKRYVSTAVDEAQRLFNESIALFDAAMKAREIKELSENYTNQKTRRGSIAGQIDAFPEKKAHIQPILDRYDVSLDAVKKRLLSV
jgi:MoxR-like ATPase